MMLHQKQATIVDAASGQQINARLKAYNQFVFKSIRKIIEDVGYVTAASASRMQRTSVRIENIRFGEPMIPSEDDDGHFVRNSPRLAIERVSDFTFPVFCTFSSTTSDLVTPEEFLDKTQGVCNVCDIPIELLASPEKEPAAGAGAAGAASGASTPEISACPSCGCCVHTECIRDGDMCRRCRVIEESEIGQEVASSRDVGLVDLKAFECRVSERRTFTDVKLFELPVMVGSRICPSTSESKEALWCATHQTVAPRGSFIFGGKPKIITPVESLRTNVTFVWPGHSPGAHDRYVLHTETRSIAPNKFRNTSTCFINFAPNVGKQRAHFMMTIPFVYKYNPSARSVYAPIPLYVVFLVLGGVSPEACAREVISEIPPDCRVPSVFELVASVFEDMSDFDGATQAEDFGTAHIAKIASGPDGAHVASIFRTLNKELFPHVFQLEGEPREAWRERRRHYLSGAVAKLIMCAAKRPDGALVRDVDKRDATYTKSVLMDGPHIAKKLRSEVNAFSIRLRQYMKQMVSAGSNRFMHPLKLIHRDPISSIIRQAFVANKWAAPNSTTNDIDICQPVQTGSRFQIMAQQDAVNSAMPKASKFVEPRGICPMSQQILDPLHTPEGEVCGLRRGMAQAAYVRTTVDAHNMVRAVFDGPCTHFNGRGMCVSVNGNPVASVEDGAAFVRYLTDCRRKGFPSFDFSIEIGRGGTSLNVSCDGGMQVFVVVPRQAAEAMAAGEVSPTCNLAHLVQRGIVTIMNDMESASPGIRIANTFEELVRDATFSHVVPRPETVLGRVSASVAPATNFNQGPRSVYEFSMGKQAVDSYSCATSVQNVVTQLFLCNPQEPLCSTRAGRRVGLNNVQVAHVASMDLGDNVEDPLIVSKGFIDRGGFHAMRVRRYTEEEDSSRESAERATFCNPTMVEDRVSLMKAGGDYSHLDKDGLIKVGTEVNDFTVLCGKVVDMRRGDVVIRECASTMPCKGERGTVTAVRQSVKANGVRVRVIVIEKLYVPEVGDKLSTQHAQKGTIGAIWAQEDMPFDRDGVPVDVIGNPHNITRMTIGEKLQMLLTTAAAGLGVKIDMTPFDAPSIRAAHDFVAKSGLDTSPMCEKILTDGRTGLPFGVTAEKPFGTPIVCGYLEMVRLPHNAADKLSVRGRGDYNSSNRQPIEGRNRNGAQRTGEMERYVMGAHGAAHMSIERLHHLSDGHSMLICTTCKQIAHTTVAGSRVCTHCGPTAGFAEIDVPYPVRVLTELTKSMGIGMHFNTKTI